jgi:hypothetical protein
MPFLVYRQWRAADLSASYLNFQADRIERILASHRYPERVVGGVVGPRTIYYGLILESPAAACGIGRLSEELALGLGVISIEIEAQGPRVVITAPRPLGHKERQLCPQKY